MVELESEGVGLMPTGVDGSDLEESYLWGRVGRKEER